MGVIDVGSQQRFTQYGSDVNSNNVNDRLLNLLPRGIYSGGWLTKVDNVTVTLSTLECEIGDGSHQVRIATTATVTVTVGSSTPYVVLRWAYSASTTNYMDVLAVSSPSANDLIVGKCSYSGATLTGISISERNNPMMMSKYLLVEPTSPASMYVRIRYGMISYGDSTISITDQLSSLLVAPVSNPRIDVIAVDTSGNISVIQGTEAASPSAPGYQGKIALAEITLQTASTSITSSMIRNVANAARATGLPVGSTIEYAGNTVPAGYLLCDASAISRTTYSALFSAIGTLWGSGDGATTFNLPPGGIVPVGYKSSDSDFNTVGKTGGEKTHTLTVNEMPAHTHPLTQTDDINTPPGQFKSGNPVMSTATTTGSTGGDQAHNNLQPYGVFKRIIKY